MLMGNLFQYALENGSLKDVALGWRVSSGQTAARLRQLPFVHLAPAGPESRSRGRPPRRLVLDPGWRFWDHAGPRPLTKLVDYLEALHSLREPFALGVPFTSTYWQPFLHPEVRLFAPPETYSLWRRLFEGGEGPLRVVVGLLPPGAGVNVREGLPVLDRPFAAVDAVLALEDVRSANVLALADRLAHSTPELELALPFARSRGLEGDLAFLKDHRRRARARVLGPRDVRLAHETEQEMASVPAGTRFAELLAREGAGA